MRSVRHSLGILVLLGALGITGSAFAAAGDKLADKGKIDQSPAADIAFGDDSGSYANDGECDDPRFSGEGAAKRQDAADLMHDATDCSAAVAAGTVTYNGEPEVAAVDFGDDTSEYANNSECDDPRFSGATGMASVLLSSDVMHDATDCKALFDAGTISVLPVYSPEYAAGAPYDPAGISFGNDTSSYANNSECDDPRFQGPGVAATVLEEDTLRDAADCQAAYVAGTAALKADAEANPDIDVTVYTSTVDPSIDFGDNSSSYANDGECDDPRFEGEGVDGVLNNSDQMHDAKDCSELFDAGKITLLKVFGPDYAAGAPYDSAGVEFGTDSSDYMNNDECDDPRFIGPGTADILLDEDQLRDATDCRTTFEAGTVVLRSGAEAKPVVDTTVYSSTKDPEIAFGDNTSTYAGNGECDDPRFEGEGMAATVLSDDEMHDAKDCSELFDAGKVAMIPVFHPSYAAGAPYDASGIDFGDDSSSYANNADCDDPRFVGPGVAGVVLAEDEMHDAADCKAAFEAGTAALKTAAGPEVTTTTTTPGSDTPATETPESETPATETPTTEAPSTEAPATETPVTETPAATTTMTEAAAIDYGDDSSEYANDEECDDPRFVGEGVDEVLLSADLMHDATDCRALVESGKISMRPVFGADYVNGAPYDTAGVDFGDNSSDYKDNGECDDPRFAGPGMAATVLDEDTLHDAADCEAKFVAGLIALK